MDLTEKIRKTFRAAVDIPKARVVKVKPVGERLLVYVVSQTFAGKSPLKRQRLVAKALSSSELTTAEQRRVGLVRALTPATLRAMKARKVKRDQEKGGREKVT